MRSKKYLALLVSIAVITGLGLVSIAGAADDTGTVSFTTQQTQEITAVNLPLGTVSAGPNDLGNKQPVTVSSNVAWQVTAIADADFTDGEVSPTTLASESLTMSGNAIENTADSGSVVQIANGGAGSFTPNIATILTIPWTPPEDLIGKELSATLTYTVTP